MRETTKNAQRVPPSWRMLKTFCEKRNVRCVPCKSLKMSWPKNERPTHFQLLALRACSAGALSRLATHAGRFLNFASVWLSLVWIGKPGRRRRPKKATERPWWWQPERQSSFIFDNTYIDEITYTNKKSITTREYETSSQIRAISSEKKAVATQYKNITIVLVVFLLIFNSLLTLRAPQHQLSTTLWLQYFS